MNGVQIVELAFFELEHLLVVGYVLAMFFSLFGQIAEHLDLRLDLFELALSLL